MWTSKTRQFGPAEMSSLEKLPIGELIPMLIRSGPLVALRALAEIMLNGDETKLAALLGNEQVCKRWVPYASDASAGRDDHQYAEQIRARLS